MKDEKPASWWWIAFTVVATVAFVALAMIMAQRRDPAPLAGRVATKLNQLHGVIYYDPEDQPSQDQQAQFGPYWTQLEKVNCREQVDRCESLGIEEAPTILVPGFGVGISGYQDLGDLELLLNQIAVEQ